MFHKKEKPLPPAETPNEPEKAPEYSGQTLRMVEEIDNSIAYSQSLLGGLDRLAREQIIADQDIDPHKKIGKLDLEKYDAREFKTANRGLWVRNLIYGSKYALKGKEGLADKRQLKEEAKGQEYILNADELKKLKKGAKKFGLNSKEIDPANFKMTFIEGEKGESAEKVILQRRTEEEMIKTAGEIMEQRLKELETGQGAKLIESNESFDELEREIEKVKSGLPPESLYKLADEEAKKLIIIDQQQKDLNDKLDIFRQPLLEHQQDIASSLSDFSFLLKDLTVQEKYYQDEIAYLQKTITGVKGSKQIGELLKDDIKDWEEQKAQTQVNLNGLKEKKEALNVRIAELKKSQTEVDAALNRINNIGKTKAEKAEEEKQQREKLRQEREYQREQRELARQPRPGGGAQRPDIYGESEEETAQTAGESDPGQGRQAAAPVGKNSRKNQPPEKPAGQKLETENNPPASAAETEQEDKENIVRKVSRWLDLLGLNNAPEKAETAIENNFKIGKIFNLNSSMILSQARQNYAQYLVDFLKISVVRAQRQAQSKFEEIIENLE